MAEPYIGEIRLFAGNFAPANWAFCNGQTLAISENDVLFNLLGTTYGGDGQTTFALPDLRGRVPVHMGQGSGLSSYVLGQNGGVEQLTLTTNQIPAHTHGALANPATGGQPGPGGNVLAGAEGTDRYVVATPNTAMYSGSISSAGGSQPHSNLQPFQCLSFIIALYGVYPSQS